MPADACICSRHTIYVHPEDERQLHATDADGGALGESVMGGQGDIGASAPITVTVGAWENVTVPGETGGGNPTVSTGQWILNPDLDVLFGNYGLSTINGLPWAPSQTLPGETGGGSTNVNSGSWAGTKDVPATTGDGKLPGSDDPDSV